MAAVKITLGRDRVTGVLDINIVLDGHGNINKITNVQLVTPDATIGNVLDLGTTYTVAGWNRAAIRILTPDGMPSPEAVNSNSPKSHAQNLEVKTPSRDGMSR